MQSKTAAYKDVDGIWVCHSTKIARQVGSCNLAQSRFRIALIATCGIDASSHWNIYMLTASQLREAEHTSLGADQLHTEGGRRNLKHDVCISKRGMQPLKQRWRVK